ncbi:hypothetical protein DDB_G0286067 [Dictyostelium discoideum AX4]|uniref:Uncharacterized protein n=1 Tax=Dictyostelium discoideum TaxID=44689 RepID=Q54MB0_DICDI|nr:hypothetical protein DDB_G0286067 [Dictyostelium discoideum AX4]EAL64412.1 hypothetical protein DDB_G0286067 [Dictyostelium discoideum AX4]|eukprot:XP_637924.1 hypothetical protein DDB_G0286067 [Dictyostelium discoideum AX4]
MANTHKFFKLFNILDSLSIDILKNAFKSGSNQIYVDKLLFPIIEIIDSINNSEASISEIFYQRMVNESRLFDPNKIKKNRELLEFIIKKIEDITMLSKNKKIKIMVIKFFEKLLHHWSNYTIDPDSSLVGLVPTDKLMSKCLLETEWYLNQSNSNNSNNNSNSNNNNNNNYDCNNSLSNSSSGINNSSSNSNNSNNNSSGSSSNNKEYNNFYQGFKDNDKEEFVKKIIQLSSIENSNELMITIRYLASLYRGVLERVKKGDLIIVTFSTILKQPINSTNNIEISLANPSNILLSKPPKTTLSQTQAKGYFSKTKIIPNRISSSSKPIKIITLEEYCRLNIKPIEQFEQDKEINNNKNNNKNNDSDDSDDSDDGSDDNDDGSCIDKNKKEKFKSPDSSLKVLNVKHNVFNRRGQFARYSGETVGDYLICYFSPEETEGVAVSLENILILGRETIDSIKSCYANPNDKKILTDIHQPTNDFGYLIGQKVKDYTVKHLKQNEDIDMNFIKTEYKKYNNNKYNPNRNHYNNNNNNNNNNNLDEDDQSTNCLKSLTKVKKMSDTVNIILNNYRQNQQATEYSSELAEVPLVYKNLEREIKKEVEIFEKSTNIRNFFIPYYGETLYNFNRNTPLKKATRKIQQIKYEIDLLFDKLNQEKLQYLDGSRKADMSDWWLNLRDSRCNEFLDKLGYKLNALPDNYIEQQPSNIQDIIKNLKIIKTILNSTSSGGGGGGGGEIDSKVVSKYSPLPLIKELTKEIYPRIHQFKNNCHLIICDEFKLTCYPGNESMKLFLNTLKYENKISKEVYDQYELLLLDLDYLTEMEQSENTNKSFHIVPISGLVIGFFSILVNELKTAIEQWSTPNDFIHLPNSISTTNLISGLNLNSVANSNIPIPPPLPPPPPPPPPHIPLSPNSASSSSNNSSGSFWSTSIKKPISIPSIFMNNRQLNSNNNNNNNNNSNNLSGQLNYNMNYSANTIGRAMTKDEKSILIKSILSEDSSFVEEVITSLKYESESEFQKVWLNEPDGVTGWAPIHFACFIGNSDIINQLLDQPGIDINIKSKQRGSALHFIVKHQYTEKRKNVINKMINKGIDINNSTKISGETPLHSCSLRGNFEWLQFLLEKGANVNAVTLNNETSLHYAITVNRIDIVDFLIKYGAKIDIKSKKRGTPIQLAANLNLPRIVELLEYHASMKSK